MGNLTLVLTGSRGPSDVEMVSYGVSHSFMNEHFNQLSEFSHVDSDKSTSNLSPQSARLRAAGIGKDFKENPSLRDNWTDAEGYYRKSVVLKQMLYLNL